MSVQWNHEELVDVFTFKPGEWEDLITNALSETRFEGCDRLWPAGPKHLA
jgi:hypothetical protein